MAGRVERRLRPAATPGYWRRHVHKESARNTGSPKAWSAMTNRKPVRDRLGALGVAGRFVVPLKPGNAGGGKGPRFKTDAIRGEGPGRLGNLSTPINVQKLKKALHAKA